MGSLCCPTLYESAAHLTVVTGHLIFPHNLLDVSGSASDKDERRIAGPSRVHSQNTRSQQLRLELESLEDCEGGHAGGALALELQGQRHCVPLLQHNPVGRSENE